MTKVEHKTERPVTTGIGFVSFEVINKNSVTVDPEEVIPDVNGNIVMTVTSKEPGAVWHFRDPRPIIIDHPQGFTVGPGGGSRVEVHHDSADKDKYQFHHYTAFFQNSRGEIARPDALEFDPVIKDR